MHSPSVPCAINGDEHSRPTVSISLHEICPPYVVLDRRKTAGEELASDVDFATSFIVAVAEYISLQVTKLDLFRVDEVNRAG